MSTPKASNFDNVIAALRLLGAAPGGAKNDPVRDNGNTCKAVDAGRSDRGFPPLPGSDRPTWAAFQRLERENQLLIDHAEMLACALGACPNCWGTISDCSDCGGVGKPGAFNPDRNCFDQFVLPIIARVMEPGDRDQDIRNPRADTRDRDHPLSTSV